MSDFHPRQGFLLPALLFAPQPLIYTVHSLTLAATQPFDLSSSTACAYNLTLLFKLLYHEAPPMGCYSSESLKTKPESKKKKRQMEQQNSTPIQTLMFVVQKEKYGRGSSGQPWAKQLYELSRAERLLDLTGSRSN